MKLSIVITLISFCSLSWANETASLLFNGNCVACHDETKTLSAPSVVEFKERYMSAFKDKGEFVKYMSKWVKNPNEEGSLMHDAIKKHGLMPELGFDEEMLVEVCAYIYETDFTKRGGKYWSK